MPASGITVYAKWIRNEYRVFLHPNVPESDTTLDWGSENQDMNFRVSSGSKVSTPTGTRSEYKLIGWYLDEDCTHVFDAEHYILNDTSVTATYNKSVDMTDEMNKYGNIIGEGTNSDALNNRFWISRKLDLYAKWRAELIGAEGIGVKYDANGGSNAPNDTNLYLDNSDTVAQGATTPPDESQQFLYWVLQTWDENSGKYVDIEGEDNKVYPGDTFTVLKSNSYVEELEGSTADNPKFRYTVQLRAEYGPKEVPTPTHIWWFPNNVDAERHDAVKADDDLQINESVDIPEEPTRDGYEFLGWARISDDTSESRRDAGGSMPTAKVLDSLTEDDLFLTYHKAEGGSAAYYTAVIDGIQETVTKVAADERDPYHDLYAVWKKKTYTVTVTKDVNGLDSDNDIPFSFTPKFMGLPSDESYSNYNSPFQLVGNPSGTDIEDGGESVHIEHTKEFIEVPYDNVFTITETEPTQANVKQTGKTSFTVKVKVYVEDDENDPESDDRFYQSLRQELYAENPDFSQQGFQSAYSPESSSLRNDHEHMQGDSLSRNDYEHMQGDFSDRGSRAAMYGDHGSRMNSESEDERTRMLGGRKPVLVSLQPDRCGDITIRSDHLILGTSRTQADIVLPGDTVSRKHARIEQRTDGYYVTDLFSTNGTFLDGHRLESGHAVSLKDGAQLTIASLHYRVTIPASA